MSVEELFYRHAAPQRADATLAFSWNGLTVRFASPDLPSVAWLAAHVYVAAHRRASAGDAPWACRSVTDGRLFDTFARELTGAAPSERREGYVGEVYDVHHEGGVTALARLDSTENRHLVLFEGGGAFLVVNDPGPFARHNATRVVRELIRQSQVGAGGLYVHASSAESEGCGLMFVGGSGAGKTTLAALYAGEGGTVVATDRSVLMGRDGDGVDVLGSPGIIRLGAGAVAALGRDPVVEHLAFMRQQPALGDGGFNDASRSFASRTKLDLTPVEFSVLFGRALADSCPLSAIVFPRPADGNWFEPLRPPEALARIDPELLHPDRDFKSFFLAGAEVAALDPHQARQCAGRLVERHPCFELHWRLDDVAGVRRALARLGQEVAGASARRGLTARG